MSWNYRILKQQDGRYGVHEVFYGSEWTGEEKNDPDKVAWTEPPVPEGLVAETLDELREMIKQVYYDTLSKPVIDEEATIANEYHIVLSK